MSYIGEKFLFLLSSPIKTAFVHGLIQKHKPYMLCSKLEFFVECNQVIGVPTNPTKPNAAFNLNIHWPQSFPIHILEIHISATLYMNTEFQ